MPKSRKRTPVTPRTTTRRSAPAPRAGLRGRIERVSSPALQWFSRRPAFVLPVLTVVLLVVGLAAPRAYGVPVLLLLLLLVGWLSYLSWPVVQGFQRVLRLAVVGMLAGAVVLRAAG